MQPLADWSLQDRRQISGIFTDIDDTLTTAGVIIPDALEALSNLKAVGLQVIPVTGRPVDALLAENGALAFAPDINDKNGLQPLFNKCRQLSKIQQPSDATRANNATQIHQVAQRVRREMPQVARALLQAQAR